MIAGIVAIGAGERWRSNGNRITLKSYQETLVWVLLAALTLLFAVGFAQGIEAIGDLSAPRTADVLAAIQANNRFCLAGFAVLVISFVASVLFSDWQASRRSQD